ncbi:MULTISPECIES: TetR/AcrR family transcriptional regulator [Sphingobium]|uniref:TetR/AcrR family transcriptional regulator n=1 Tax=Sphingobium TaxID=165695 RepID=UPI000C080D98|nr:MULTISPECIES: TetR/AcrR family transcriptional regulator [Sphingobium]WDA39237.1 helix-turn-helix domain containing protein [Sphingobium sp. YC-XJ3]
MVKTQDPDFDRLKTREKIIEAASELFVEKGYAAASISKVAARAKVLAGSVYWAFPSKEALFAEVIRSAGRRWYKKYFPKSEILPVDIHGLRDEFVQLAAGFAADPAFIKLETRKNRVISGWRDDVEAARRTKGIVRTDFQDTWR